LHTGVARVLGKDPAPGPESINHGGKAADERQNQRRVACHFFFSYVVFAWRGLTQAVPPLRCFLVAPQRAETIGQPAKYTGKLVTDSRKAGESRERERE